LGEALYRFYLSKAARKFGASNRTDAMPVAEEKCRSRPIVFVGPTVADEACPSLDCWLPIGEDDNMGVERHSAEIPAQRRFALAGKSVDPSRNVVVAEDGERVLEPKMMDVLCVLVDRRGEVVSREELIDLVWGRSFGTDESLTRAVYHIRKAFAVGGDQPAVIETVPKRGYRLVGEVGTDFDEPWAKGRVARASRRAVAIITLILVLTLLVGMIAWRRPPDGGRQASTPPGIGVSVSVAQPTDATPWDRQAAADIMSQLANALSRVSLLQVTREAASIHRDGGGSSLVFAVEGSLARDLTRTRASITVRDAGGRIVWAHDFERSGLLALRDP
jgi:DNA-binding winged helix-turn-helix (wHTH) protein